MRPTPPALTSLPLLSNGPPITAYQGDCGEDIKRIKTIRRATEITGGLSKPSKMPEYGYSLPASECRVGGRLQAIRGSVCQRCYALTNRFRMPAVQRKMRQRFEALFHPLWVPAMALLIGRRAVAHFRWHDSGDLQGLAHLENIAAVAEHTRRTLHWLPTREYATVKAYLQRHGDFPANLTVRASAHLIGGPPPEGFSNTATVVAARPPAGSHVCPAPDQGNKCAGEVQDCRACWDRGVQNVVYWLH